MLFISEFMIIKTMFLQNQIALCIVFLLLLTIILYGLTKSVLRMSFLPINIEKQAETDEAKTKIDWTMYLPQIIMLIIAFTFGIYMPEYLTNIITYTVIGY